MIERLRNDFQLATIALLGLTTATIVAGFAVFRVMEGDMPRALTDAAIAAAIAIIVAFAWRTGRTVLAGNVMAILDSAGCVLALWLAGAGAIGWVYVALMTNFFIAGRRVAAITNVVLIGGAALVLSSSVGGASLASALITWILLSVFAFAFSVRTQRYNVQLETMASMDTLTRVPNRRMMEEALVAAMADKRSGNKGLLILDVDKFKQVNDTFGHSAGDAVLADLAAILRFELRQGDAVFRFGGEEFVMLLPAPTQEALEQAADRLRRAVYSSLRGPGGRVTVSIGGAVRGNERDWQDWFSRADQALYEAKRAGGNVVHVLGPMDTSQS